MVSHPATLRGIAFDTHGAPVARPTPLIVEVSEDNFVAALLAALRTPDGRSALMTQARDTHGVTLLQPVHRTFYVALFEAVCDIPGAPPLARQAIESAGMVIRRVVDRAATTVSQGWFSRDGASYGWRNLDRALDSVSLADLDPEPRRRRTIETGSDAVDAALKARAPDAHRTLAESVGLLFVAPPDVCAAVGRTVVYGVVSTASGEAEEPGALAFDDADVNQDFPPWLVAGASPPFNAIQGRSLSPGDLTSSSQSDYHKQLRAFVLFLRKLRTEYRAIGEASVRHDGFHRALAALDVPGAGPASTLLESAAQCLLDQRVDAWTAPAAWPTITAAQEAAFRAAAKGALQTQATRVAPRIGRFDANGARYQVRGFIRVRGEPQCPPTIRWSKEGVLFLIAPWHAPGKRPPVLVTLPKVTRENVKTFLPNVTFSVPGDIQALLANNSPEDFLKGRAKGSPWDIGWICGFNIPLITLCAFIVLSIFLVLLHIVFWWLPFIKVCIPIPGALRKRLEGGSA